MFLLPGPVLYITSILIPEVQVLAIGHGLNKLAITFSSLEVYL